MAHGTLLTVSAFKVAAIAAGVLGLSVLGLIGAVATAAPAHAAGAKANALLSKWDADHDGTLDAAEVDGDEAADEWLL